MKITIAQDTSCEMLSIKADDKCIFHGNVWDFDRSADGFKKLLEQLGHKVKIVNTDMSNG